MHKPEYYNVETKPALFRANIHQVGDLHMVVPAFIVSSNY